MDKFQEKFNETKTKKNRKWAGNYDSDNDVARKRFLFDYNPMNVHSMHK